MAKIYRQGDVLIQKVSCIPANAKPVQRDNGRVVLAYGEVTGHAHAIAEPHVQLLEVTADAPAIDQVDAEIRYLYVAMEAYLRHEEHATIKLPPGQYRVIRQREYTPEAIRNVAD